MPKSKPYDQFGPYILFKRLETDALGDLFRAARITDDTLGPMVALRRLSGGNRAEMTAAAATATQVAPLLVGTSFVREQAIDVIDGIPYVAHDYAGGRSLRYIVNRARGGNGVNPQPIPIDQALVIAERVALSLSTTAEMRMGGDRLSHGALVPQFIWINEDGEIRVAGQQLGRGLVASLGDAKVSSEIGRYFSPEYAHSRKVSATSEVYSLGAILYLVVTGHEPPDPTSTSAFMSALRAAKTMAGTPVPDEIRRVLEKSLNLDPSARFANPSDMKQALSALTSAHGATTFNLAFYLSNLLKKEMEAEASEREKESKVNVAPYLVHAAPAETAVAAGIAAPAKKRSLAPIGIAAALVIALAGGGAWLMLAQKKSATTAAPATNLASATTAAPPPRPAVTIPEAIVASPSTTTATDTAAQTQTATDEAAKKKAFEEAVRQKLRDEMLKLQAEYTRSLQQQQSKSAPVQTASLSPSVQAPVLEEPSAAQLDLQRRETARQQPATTTVASVPQPQPQPVNIPETQPQNTPAVTTQAPVEETHVIREGDIIDFAELDAPVTVVRQVKPVYPPIAVRQRIEANVLLTALISENGDVVEVKVLRGDPRFGFNEAAANAVKRWKYTGPRKEGKRVRTWVPQIIQFRP